MATQPIEQRGPDDKSEADVDKAVEDTFPASDPPSTGGATKIGAASGTGDVSGVDHDEDLADEEPPIKPSPDGDREEEQTPTDKPAQ